MIGRIFGIILILVATLVPGSYLVVMTYPEVQLVIGSFIVLYIIGADAIGGLLMGIAVLIMYLQAYSYKFNMTWYEMLSRTLYTGKKREQFVNNYTTAADLENAQNNIVDPMNSKVEIKGIEGVYGEEVYGAQGMDKTLPAYDSSNRFMTL